MGAAEAVLGRARYAVAVLQVNIVSDATVQQQDHAQPVNLAAVASILLDALVLLEVPASIALHVLLGNFASGVAAARVERAFHVLYVRVANIFRAALALRQALANFALCVELNNT